MKFAVAAAALLSVVALSACGKGGLANRGAPDEFAISRNAPLVMPPDFALTPPRPGEPRPLTQDSSQTQAAQALFGPGVRVPPKSASELNILDKAGATKPDPAIRSNAGDPKTPTVDKGAFLKELMGAPVGTANAQTAQVTIGS
ncbi:DUF3035 domain-containing protein [Glacieibacterium sp.]|uniref:DUF3035 domain-containing protein n=1 Tax=Glacieibacterium sp. TaxID=2860237 RepID=UPI003B00B53A